MSVPVALAELGVVTFFAMDDRAYVGCRLGSVSADQLPVPDGDEFWVRDFGEGDDYYVVFRRSV